MSTSRRSSSTGSSSSSSSSYDSDSSYDSLDEEPTLEYMNSLLAAAKQNLSAKALGKRRVEDSEVLPLGNDEERPLPHLEPGSALPKPYFKLSKDREETGQLINDPEVAIAERSASVRSIAATLPPAPELSKKTGLPLTKAEKKAMKEATAGPGWFDLPAPPASELPRLAREVDALRLRNALDPKRFYRKEDTKSGPLPKHFAMGHIINTPSPFTSDGARNHDGVGRKRTLVDELMDDDEARTYAKKKFNELQGVRGERGRGTFRRKFAKRERKF